MAGSKGIQRHPLFKLGKAAAKRDERNLRLQAVLLLPPKIPREYDFDVAHKGIPAPMFANDLYGDCVIAGRAHQSLRFELLEQKKLIKIADADVVDEYFEEADGIDSGLVVLDSLRLWRKRGWIAARKRYFIKAFAEIDRTKQSEVKRAIFMELGVGIGLSLPLSAQEEFEAGKPWKRVSGKGSSRGSWGGHYVYVSGYTPLGPTCVTWGRKQRMSWAFFKKYCDEAYAIIDQINTSKKRKGLSSPKLEEFLGTVSKPAGRRSTKAKRPRSSRAGAKTAPVPEPVEVPEAKEEAPAG